MKNNIQEAADYLGEILEKKDWYVFSAPDKDCITVYVHYMNEDIMKYVPHKFNDFFVKLAYYSYFQCEEKYSKPVALNVGVEKDEAELYN
jgi:hypothetical protein